MSKILNFYRLWATLNFPKYLRALDRIQEAVYTKRNLLPGSYESYASQVENLFIAPTLVILDEYGIPIQLARKLSGVLTPTQDLDHILAQLKSLNLANLNLDNFEIELLQDFQRNL